MERRAHAFGGSPRRKSEPACCRGACGPAALSRERWNGVTGYSVLATADERVEVDALLVSRDHGLVAFLLPDTVPVGAGEWDRLVSDQDRLYAVIEDTSGGM